jgi:hypothetical protein
MLLAQSVVDLPLKLVVGVDFARHSKLLQSSKLSAAAKHRPLCIGGIL